MNAISITIAPHATQTANKDHTVTGDLRQPTPQGTSPAPTEPRPAAAAIDRFRRIQAPCRSGTITRDIPQGWVSVRPDHPCGDFPSSAGNRVYWHAPSRTITEADIAEAARATRDLGAARTYIWLAPWASNADTDAALTAAGATRWPHVEYVALARPTDPSPPPPTPFTVRAIEGAERDTVLDRIIPWYSAEGVTGIRTGVEAGFAQTIAVFDNDAPIAVGLLMIDGEWAYLGAAGTDPAHRNRGAQKALIRARVRMAAQQGASTCLCETNTAVPVSLTNLVKCNFTPIIAWRVYRWDL